MRKAFKVATAFTGAAAAATVFTPAAAMAATALPDYGPVNCTGGAYTTSVHLNWLGSEHHGPTCFRGDAVAYSGFGTPPTAPKYGSVCPGSYIGHFGSVSRNGGPAGYFSFGSGVGPTRTFPTNKQYAVSILLTSTDGNGHQCLG